MSVRRKTVKAAVQARLHGSRLRRRRRGGSSQIWSGLSYGVCGVKRLSDSGVIQPKSLQRQRDELTVLAEYMAAIFQIGL